jgi:hypothetical protein
MRTNVWMSGAARQLLTFLGEARKVIRMPDGSGT